METLPSHIARLFKGFESGGINTFSKLLDPPKIENLIVKTKFKGNALQIVPARYSNN